MLGIQIFSWRERRSAVPAPKSACSKSLQQKTTSRESPVVAWSTRYTPPTAPSNFPARRREALDFNGMILCASDRHPGTGFIYCWQWTTMSLFWNRCREGRSSDSHVKGIKNFAEMGYLAPPFSKPELKTTFATIQLWWPAGIAR